MEPVIPILPALPSLPAPIKLTRAQWQGVTRDAWRAAARHNLALISAGVAFFSMLALFPALSAVVALFGLFADPTAIGDLLDSMRYYAPAPVLDLAREQVQRLISADTEKLALHGGVSLVVAMWSAQQGGRSFLRALTIVNERGRRRGFWGRYLFGGAFTFGALFTALLMIFAFTLAPRVFGEQSRPWIEGFRAPILIALVTAFAMALYRWGPARRPPAWRWVWPGAVAAAIAWLIVTAAFSLYVDVFTPMRAIYGVFSSVYVLMLWLFFSAYIFLLGAELNAQLERICAASPEACETVKTNGNIPQQTQQSVPETLSVGKL